MGNIEIFNRIANEYDTTDRIQIAKVASDAIRESLVDATNKKGIDFGCGTGLVGMNLLADFNSVLFLDSSQNMIDQIKFKIEINKINNADTLCFDFENDNTSDLHADYIFMAQVLLHIQDIEFILSRLYNVLNEEGHLIIVDFNKNEEVVSDMVHSGFDQGELIKLMTKLGFRKSKSKTFYSGNKIFMNQNASLFILDAQK